MIFDCDVIVGGYVGGFLSEFGAPLRELLARHNTFEPDSSYLKFSRYQLESSALGAALVQVAFNLGNALGAYCGGLPIAHGLGYEYTALPGAGFTLLGLLAAVVYIRKYPRHAKR